MGIKKMGKFVKLYASKKTAWKHVLFRYGDDRLWRFHQNWKCHFSLSGNPDKVFFCCVITPFLRVTKCNGKIELGLGNHYLEFGF